MTEDIMVPAPEPSAPPPPSIGSRIAWVFSGADGLRAGWSILVFLLVLALLITAIAHFLLPLLGPHGTGPATPARMMLAEGISAITVIVAALVMALIERRSFQLYGLGGRRRLPDFLMGLGWGVVMLSVLAGLLLATGALAIDGVALSPGAALTSGIEWLAVFFLVGLFEEFAFRGYLQFTLARGVAGVIRAIAPADRRAATVGFWAAALVLSVGLFAAAHASNGGESAFGLFSVALAGIVFVFSLWRTGSLWWAIGFHTSWDWAQSYLYGVADSGLAVQGHLLNSHPVGNPTLSGGTVGPEGSVLLVPVLFATLYVIHRTLPKRPAPLG